MTDAKIALTMITSDDREFEMLERCLNSFMPQVDKLYISVNGQGDTSKTESLLRKYGAVYEKVNPETAPELYDEVEGKLRFTNFAAARNRSWALVPKGEYDYLTWADVDDVYTGTALKDVANQAKLRGLDSVFFTYWYSVTVEKTSEETIKVKDVVIQHLRERLIKPELFHWKSRLHEVCIQKDDNFKPKHSVYDYDLKAGRDITWIHMPPADRPAQNLLRNSIILEIQAKEEEYKDPRTTFYLAKTYFDMNDPVRDELALHLLFDYLEKSGWDAERGNACEYIGLIYERKKDINKAITSYLRGLQEYPMHHLLNLRLASAYYQVGKPEFGRHYMELAIRMDAPKAETTIGNELEIKLIAASLKYNEAARKQDLEEMVRWARIRADLTQNPDDPLLKGVLEAKELNEAAKNVFAYAKWLKDNKHADRIEDLLRSLPLELGREAFASYIANQIKDPKVWPSKSIVYYASFGGEHFEQWSAHSTDKGIGGSETAVIELAKEWVKMGYDVTVYGDPRDDAGDIDGVHYRPYYEINWNDTFDTLILWRSPHLLDRDIKAKKIYMDLHDIASPLDWNEARIAKVNKVFFKSKWHRNNLPNIPDDKCVVISNGIYNEK